MGNGPKWRLIAWAFWGHHFLLLCHGFCLHSFYPIISLLHSWSLRIKKHTNFSNFEKPSPALFLFLCNTCSVMEITLRLFFPLAACQLTDIACGCMKSKTHGFSYFVSGFMAISLPYLLSHNMKSEDTEWNLSFIKPANPHKTKFLWILGLCKLALPSFPVCFLDANQNRISMRLSVTPTRH